MSAKNVKHIVFLLGLLVLSGCASTCFDVTVQDQMGQTIDHRTLKTKDFSDLMNEMYSSFVQGDFEKCRGLGEVVKEVWQSEQDAISEASRLSAWSTLFLYRENHSDLTSLENEKRNLLILRKASSEFAGVKGHWGGEAEVVMRIINARYLNRPAFNAFVKNMKVSTESSLLSQDARTKALSAVTNEYPDWSQSAGVWRLNEYSWREISE